MCAINIADHIYDLYDIYSEIKSASSLCRCFIFITYIAKLASTRTLPKSTDLVVATDRSLKVLVKLYEVQEKRCAMACDEGPLSHPARWVPVPTGLFVPAPNNLASKLNQAKGNS